MNTKNILFYLMFALTTGCFFSCQDDVDVRIVLDTVEDGMKLSVNEEEIVLSQDLMNETALTLTWQPAQKRNNNGEISYYLKLGLAGLTKVTDKIELPEDVYEYSIAHFDLNVLMYGILDIPYGSTAELEAELIAVSEGDFYVKPEISTVKFMVTSFAISPVNLYLVGSANPYGPELEHGIKLTEIVEGRDIGNKYKWEGNLNEGTFRFVGSLTGEDKGLWGKGDNEQKLIAGSSVEFQVTKAGLNSIIINKDEQEIIHGYKGFSHIWGVGEGMGIAWIMPSDREFSWNPRNPSIFTMECNMVANKDFKLPYNDQGAGWGCPFLRPMAENTDIWNDNRVQAVFSGGDDLKWLTTSEQAGECIMTIDAYNMTISLEKKN